MKSWNTSHHGVVSLFDMLEFNAAFFVYVLDLLGKMEQSGSIDTEQLENFKGNCGKHKLETTEARCQQALDEIGTSGFNAAETIRAIRDTLKAELHANVFLHLESFEKTKYTKPIEDWDTVIGRYPNAELEITESSKCYALERYDAAVFHALLVAEMVVMELAQKLIPDDPKPGWNSMNRLNKAIVEKPFGKLSQTEQIYQPLLQEFLPKLDSICQTWRHRLTHIANKQKMQDGRFSKRYARETVGTLSSFTRQLVKKLNEIDGIIKK